MIRAANLGNYVKIRLGAAKVEDRAIDSKRILEVSQLRLDDCKNDMAKTSSLNMIKDMLKESLEGVYERLEENKKDTDKRINEMKEASKLQHRDSRRRVARLEQKTISGYFK